MSVFLSAFLSHSSADKPFVEAVAKALGRLGVVPWVDKNELLAGQSLVPALREAIEQQTLLVYFLSGASLESAWVQDELRHALDLDSQRPDWIIPVYLGSPLPLVRMSPLLSDHWLHPNGDRVSKLGIVVTDQTPEGREREAMRVAREIARRLYHSAKLPEAREVNVVLDQRGSGPRTGTFKLPSNVSQQGSPTLVFRPDCDQRSEAQTLTGADFEELARDIKNALEAALETLRSDRTVRVFGDAQLGLYFALGRYFNRTTRATLYVRNNQSGLTFTNQGQLRTSPLQGGNARCETTSDTVPAAPAKITPGTPLGHVALYVGTRQYLAAVRAHVAATTGIPLVFVETSFFNDSNDVMRCVADVVALLERLRDQHGAHMLSLYTAVPNAAVTLLAANLTHVMENVEIMEFRRDYASETFPPAERYAAVRIP